MMSKDKKDQAKRRQKKMAKQKSSRGARLEAYRTERIFRARELNKGVASVAMLSDDDYLFWLCHGVNYLTSDSEQGLWDPLFEDIYAGAMPDPEMVAQAVMTRYHDEMEAGEFGGLPRAVLAWTVLDRDVMSIYKHEAVRRIKALDPECDAEDQARKPHNPTVWTLMDKVRARSLAAGDAMDEDEAKFAAIPDDERLRTNGCSDVTWGAERPEPADSDIVQESDA